MWDTWEKRDIGVIFHDTDDHDGTLSMSRSSVTSVTEGVRTNTM